MIDTHAHLYDAQFDEPSAIIDAAVGAGVSAIFLPAIDSQSHNALIDLCRTHPDRCFAMMGLHPTSVNDNPRFRDELRLVEEYLENPPVKFYAIGEAGLDLYWSSDFLAEQLEAMRFQIELALRYSLPIVLHTRDAFEPMLALLEEYRGSGLRGVFHSFAGSAVQYQTFKTLGDFKFGIGGVLTYKKAAIAETLKSMQLSDIVLETDAPYLPPVPFRGKRNESSYLRYVAAKVAEIHEVSVETVDRITTENARQLFGIG